MTSRRIFDRPRDRGFILAVIFGTLVLVASVAVVAVSVALSEHSSMRSLEARLEAARAARAYGRLIETDTFHQVASDASTVQLPTWTAPLTHWSLDSSSVDGAALATNFLSEARTAVGGSDRDLGIPGSLPWLAPFSEAIHAQGSLSFSRESWTDSSTLHLTSAVEATLWRIPAGAVRLTVSGVTPDFRFPVVASGLCVVVPPTDSNGLTNISGTIIQPSSGMLISAGADPASRITTVYGLGGASPGFERILTDTDAPPAGIAQVSISGVKYLGMDLRTYRGPSALSIRGTAVANGFVLIGNSDPSSSTASEPLSVAVDGPLILLGSNIRYVFAATNRADVRFYSQASYDAAAQSWVVPGGQARDMDWTGHIFIAATDLHVTADENWSGKRLTIHGSMHLVGGTVDMIGQNAATLASTGISIVEPTWSNFTGSNPFALPVRHESLAVCLTQ